MGFGGDDHHVSAPKGQVRGFREGRKGEKPARGGTAAVCVASASWGGFPSARQTLPADVRNARMRQNVTGEALRSFVFFEFSRPAVAPGDRERKREAVFDPALRGIFVHGQKNNFGSRKSACYLVFKVTEVLDNFCLARVCCYQPVCPYESPNFLQGHVYANISA